jgi:hypothetical protein
VREPSGDGHFEGFPELAVRGLDDRDALELLGTVAAGPLDERVRDRIVAETRGNPLALLELTRPRQTLAELAGGFGLSDGLALSGRIEQSFTERLAPLPRPHGCCFSSRRPSRWGIRCWCGGLPRSSASGRTRPRRPPAWD